MASYKEIDRIISKGNCWTEYHSGEKCIRPSIAIEARKLLKPVVGRNKKREAPFFPLCVGCPRAPGTRVLGPRIF